MAENGSKNCNVWHCSLYLILAFCCLTNGQNINSSTKEEHGKEQLKCAESYCLPASYDKLEVPFDESGMVKVSVDFDTLQILDVDDIKFTVMFSMYFGVRWQEPRIVGPAPDDENYYQPIDTGFIKHLWVPDIYLWYLKEIEVLDFLIPFAGWQCFKLYIF